MKHNQLQAEHRANPWLLMYVCDNQRKYLSLKFIIIA